VVDVGTTILLLNLVKAYRLKVPVLESPVFRTIACSRLSVSGTIEKVGTERAGSGKKKNWGGQYQDHTMCKGGIRC